MWCCAVTSSTCDLADEFRELLLSTLNGDGSLQSVNTMDWARSSQSAQNGLLPVLNYEFVRLNNSVTSCLQGGYDSADAAGLGFTATSSLEHDEKLLLSTHLMSDEIHYYGIRRVAAFPRILFLGTRSFE